MLGSQRLFHADVRDQWVPWQKFVFDSLRRGEAPFWNPHLMLGFSQLGESQVGIFYPPKLLTYFIADLQRGFALIVGAHMAAAGIGTYLLLRVQRLGRAAALFGGISFGLSGYLFAQATNYGIPLAASFLPWFVLTLGLYFERRRLTWLLGFSALLGLQLLISHVSTTFIMLTGASGYYLVYALRGGHFWRDAGLYVAAIGAAVGLAAIQVFPTLELKPLSERSGQLSYAYITEYSLGFKEHLSYFFPWLLGSARGSALKGFEELHYYAGAATPALALAGLLSSRGVSGAKRTFLLAAACTALLAFLLSLGDWFPVLKPWLLLYRLPVFNMFRIPARWGALVTFGISIAAAVGVDALVKRRVKTRVLLAGALALPTLALAAAALEQGWAETVALFGERPKVIDAPTSWLESSVISPLTRIHPFFMYGAGVILLVSVCELYRRQILSARRFGVGLVALIAVDLFLIESPLNPRMPASAGFVPEARTAELARGAPYCRFVPSKRREKSGMPMNIPAYFGVFSVTGDTPLELASFIELRKAFKRADVLDYVGACFDFSKKGSVERPGAMDRAFVVSELRSAGRTRPLEKFLKLKGNAMKSVVYLSPEELERAQRELGPDQDRPAAPEQSVTIERYENSRVALVARTSAPGMLVLTDMMYPGWSARVDDQPAFLYAPQGVFRGVMLPAGTHRVEFRYRSGSVVQGAIVSLLTLAGMIAGLLWLRRFYRERANSTPSSLAPA